MTPRYDFRHNLRARGAIASKLALVVALGAGVFWSAPSLRGPAADAPDVAGAPVAQNEPAQRPAPGLAPQSSPDVGEGRDPFAGVDIGSNPVLRHITGIVEPKRADRANDAQARPAPVRIAAASRETNSGTQAPPAPAPAAPAPVARALPDAAAKPAAEPDARVSSAPVAAPAANAPVVTAPAATAAPEAEATRVALARVEPSPATPPAVAPPRAIRRTVPAFPNDAIKAGIKTGRVLARVTIDADGRVSDTHVLSARPPGYFERESQRALANWRYEAPGRSTSAEVELLFSRD